MASVNYELFQKFQKASQIPKRQEGDGHEVQVEVREDEEQTVKLQEIIDLLVAAGYFRARIKGLSPFDKVVGGMTWCIESLDVDVDVDLLFQENSTIGQKIALTEKIVAMLPKIKCPHRIEPHQIQGLDFIHIFPVIQWLVRTSMEARQEKSAFVRSYAISQFDKEFSAKNETDDSQKKIAENLKIVNEVYRPHRYYKRKNAPPPDILSRVQITLLEYGFRGGETSKNSLNTEKENQKEENNEKSIIDEEQKKIDHLLANLTATNEEILHDDLTEEDKQKLTQHYESLHSELKDGGVQSKINEKISLLEEQNRVLEINISKLKDKQKKLQEDLENELKILEETKLMQSEAEEKLKQFELEEENNPSEVKEIEELVRLNDSLKAQETQFKETCRKELARLQEAIRELKEKESPSELTPEQRKEVEEFSEKNKLLRLTLAKKNQVVAKLQRQLDDVPNRAELSQYQRRFLELYNQVSAKHKETKQYYSLYNTLQDKRLYMQKELSLLNSVVENFPQAMLSAGGKEEFLSQFQKIVEGVRQNRLKLEAQLVEEKKRKDQRATILQGVLELQRAYANSVRQLSLECRKLEMLAGRRNQE